MPFALRLRHDARDLAALRTLAEALPQRHDVRWEELSVDGVPVLLGAPLDARTARALAAEGLVVGPFALDGDACEFTPISGASEHFTNVRERTAHTLWEALRPRASSPELDVAQGCFVASRGGGAAQRLVERLLSLGRDDATVTALDGDDGAWLRVDLARPPAYLLLRSRDEPGEGVRAYVTHGRGGLGVAFGVTHPLAAEASRTLDAQGRCALVDADGTWRWIDAKAPRSSLYDALAPRLEARRETWRASPEATRFTVTLRLAPTTPRDAELWLLDAVQLLALEPLVESLPEADLARFAVTRTEGPSGACWVLRERVRPNVPRLGSRVTDTLEIPGYARVDGVENLYVPCDRRLVPAMRRDALRALLGTADAALVVVTEDGDGTCVRSVTGDADGTLRDWVAYVAADHRATLDPLRETGLFDWPELAVEAPAAAPATAIDEPSTETSTAPRITAVSAPATIPTSVKNDDGEALRAAMAPLEDALASGARDDAGTWRSLGALKVRAAEHGEAAACFEAVLFLAPGDADAAKALGDARGAEASSDATATLGARVLHALAARDATWTSAMLRDAAGRFAMGDPGVSRRLAWAVLRAVHGRSGDALELTRAKERLLGGVNDRGLSETHDLPRFVRHALARAAQGDEGAAALRHAEQLRCLEDLWRDEGAPRATREGPLALYLRVIFATGFARLGAAERADALTEPVRAAMPAQELANRVLLQLYLARRVHDTTRGTDAAWQSEVLRTMAPAKASRAQDHVVSFRKKSPWLRGEAADAPEGELRPTLERGLREAEALDDATTLAARVTALLDDGAERRPLYEHEAARVCVRGLRAALRSGSDGAVTGVLGAVRAGLAARKWSPERRAQVLGVCVEAAAALGDGDAVLRGLDEVAVLAPSVAAPRELVRALRPSLGALRRFGAAGAAEGLLDALAATAKPGVSGGLELRAVLAGVAMSAGSAARAEAWLAEAVEGAAATELSYEDRYDAAAAALEASRHWPVAPRAAVARRMLGSLDAFTDAFTASAQGLFERYKLLLLERVIDALADEATWSGDRVRGWLDDDEQALRRRILDDWRTACGR